MDKVKKRIVFKKSGGARGGYNSPTVAIPADIAKALSIEKNKNEYVEISLSGDRIIIDLDQTQVVVEPELI